MGSERQTNVPDEGLRPSHARIYPDDRDPPRGEVQGPADDVLPQIGAVVWTTDVGLTITSVTGGGLSGLGLTPEQLVGNTMLAHDVADRRFPATVAHRRALRGASASYSFTHDGTWYLARVDPLRGDDGTITGTIGITVDVSDLGHRLEDAERAIRQEHDENDLLRVLNQTKDALIGSIAHDLRSPLATILLIAETLASSRSEFDAETLAELHTRIGDNARRISRFLTTGIDPLDATRGSRSPQTCVDIGSLVRMIVEGTDPPGRQVITDVTPVDAEVDPIAVERIVQNLLANALQHTPPGSPIWVRVAPSGGKVLIAVEDAGPGVPDEMKAAIFVPTVHAGSGAGSGIGLSLVARFAALMGGRAWVEDRAGGGASFRVLVPARHQRQRPRPDAREPREGRATDAAEVLLGVSVRGEAAPDRRGRPRRSPPMGHR